MLGAVVHAVGNPGPLHLLGRIEHAETEARGEQAAHGDVDFGFGDQALLHGGTQSVVLMAAVDVGSSFHSQSRSFFGRGGDLMAEVDVAYCSAVGDHVPVE